MRMIVMGCGPMGGIIAGGLAHRRHDITFVDVDAEHVRAIRDHGLHVETPDAAFNVRVPVVFPSEIEGTYDVGFIAVRSNHTSEALNSVAPHLSDNGILVSLQNGINPPLLEEIVGPDRAVGVVILMRGTRPAPGHVRTATRGELYVGHIHGKTTPQLQMVQSLLDPIIPTKITDNIFGVLWSKLTFTCLGYFASLADESLNIICQSELNQRLCVDFFGEIVEVGKAVGARFIPLKEYNPLTFQTDRPYNDRLAVVREIARQHRGDDRKGPIRQLKEVIKTEVDFTVGYVICEGEKLNVPTPICRAVLRIIHEIEDGRIPLRLQNYGALAAD
jgi:2-dehydropantoate 2-reductase